LVQYLNIAISLLGETTPTQFCCFWCPPYPNFSHQVRIVFRCILWKFNYL